MVSETDILSTINKLDEKYNSALLSESPQDAIFYAKLALLEYCGWLEETFDDIVRASVDGKLKTRVFKDVLEKEIIKRTYGFQYRNHFVPMLMRSIGIVEVEKLENEMNKNGGLDILIAELKAVKKTRNDAAHTWIAGTTKTYEAPSVTTGRLGKVFPVIESIYGKVTKQVK
ncbi:MAG: endoribonuclease [Anaerolineae bacterium]|jgi:hypothetical protein|nr:endoribonuclease [Anaerolineae bacterium]